MPRSSSPPDRRTGPLASLLGVTFWLPFLLAIAAFAGGSSSDFVFDDRDVVRDGAAIAPGADFGTAITLPYGPQNTNRTLWRPLTVLAFAVERRLFGTSSPVPYHAVNLLLHGLVSVLVARVALRLGTRPAGAALAGSIFAVHPIHSEAVIGIVGLAELLAASLFLAALLVALDDFRIRGSRLLGLGASAGLFGLALLAKENAATFGLVIPLVGLCRGERVPRLLVPLVAHALVLALVLAARAAVLGGVFFDPRQYVPFLDNPLAHAATDRRVLTALGTLARYAGLLLLPIALSVDYSYDSIPVVSRLDAAALAGIALIASLLFLLLHYRRRRPALAFGAGFFLATFALTSNLFFPIGTIFGERLAYLPSVGFALMAGAVASGAGASRPGARVAVSLLVAALAIRSEIRAADFHTQRSLFESAVRVEPASAKAWHNVAKERGADNDAAGAEAAYRRAVQIDPGLGEAWYGLGRNLYRRRRVEEAESAFRSGIENDPSAEKNDLGLGEVLVVTGRYDEAVGVALRLAKRDRADLAAAILELLLKNEPDFGAAREALESIRRPR